MKQDTCIVITPVILLNICILMELAPQHAILLGFKEQRRLDNFAIFLVQAQHLFGIQIAHAEHLVMLLL